MITNIHIENFKSIENMDLPLGSLNILIGENGCGKTNILEAAAIGIAASQDKLDNEYLAARGIRKTENRFMKSAFNVLEAMKNVKIDFTIDNNELIDILLNVNEYGMWENIAVKELEKNKHSFMDIFALTYIKTQSINNKKFIIYAAENSSLSELKQNITEGLGVRGEGLFDYLLNITRFAMNYNKDTFEVKYRKNETKITKLYEKSSKIEQKLQSNKVNPDHITWTKLVIKQRNYSNEIRRMRIKNKLLLDQKFAFEQLPKIKAHLRELLDWFEDFKITGSNMERKLYIKDYFLPEKTFFDQKSANEGFLLLLFYLTLFTGAETSSFFAIDNIDTGLNPKLGSRLIEILAKLAKEHNKQAIITTHNPAILDGLDLRDDAQRLFVVSRNMAGKTKIERIENEPIMENGIPLKLSEKFMRGYIGGLPKNF